jgi:hypothetical protein
VAPDEEELDQYQARAIDELRGLFDRERTSVFYSRQLEVRYERQWFHWVTNRALRDLIAEGEIITEERELASAGGTIHLMWHRSHRDHKRDAERVIGLVNEYCDPAIAAALGLQREMLVLEGFARQFVMRGRNTRRFEDARWTTTEHDLNFIFERAGLAYGVEVKNVLGYMDKDELDIKVDLCAHLGLRPVFAVRALPKSWAHEVIGAAGGYAMVLGYQLEPQGAGQAGPIRVGTSRGHPDSAGPDWTMDRFLAWHLRQL